MAVSSPGNGCILRRWRFSEASERQPLAEFLASATSHDFDRTCWVVHRSIENAIKMTRTRHGRPIVGHDTVLCPPPGFDF